jgi:WD40 repeat protein
MDATLRVWDAATGEQLFVVRRKEGDFGRVCFAPGGKVVAAGHSPDLVADVWWVDAATGKVTGRKELAGVKVRKADPAVRFSPDGSRLAVGDWSENRFLFLDTAGAGELWAAKLGGEVPGGVGFAADGETVAVGTAAGKVRLFDTDGKPREVLSSDAKGLTNVALSPDGSQVTAAAGDDALAWDRATGKPLWKQRAPAGYSLAYSPDGKAIVRSGYGYQAGTIDPADGLGGGVNGKPGAYFGGMVEATCSVFRPDGKAVAFGTISGAICLFEPASGKPASPSADPPHEVRWMRFSPDGKTLYGWAGDWFAWDVATGRQKRVTSAGWNYGEPLSPDGRLTARTVWYSGERPAESDEGARLEVRDAATGTVLHSHEGRAFQGLSFMAFTGDATAIIGALPDGTLCAWAADSGEELFRLPGHKGLSREHALSADGRVLVTGSSGAAESPVRVYDLRAGKELAKLAPGLPVVAVAVSGDGRRVAAVTSANARGRRDPREVAVVWDVASGKELARVPQGREGRFVALSADGRLVALASDWDGGVRVIEVASGGERFAFHQEGQPTGLAFSPDGRVLAAASKEAPVLLWDVAGALAAAPPAWGEGSAARAWEDLASADAAKGFAAVRLLRANPEKALAILAERTKPPAVPANLKELVADLGSEDFATRERASAALASLGESARPALADAARGADPEAAKRASDLLARIDGPRSHRVRLSRAVEAVEGMGTRGSGELLARWAGGSGGKLLAAEAAAALERPRSAWRPRPR